MPTYRLLALDMDGTLLTSDKRISPRTLHALRDASARGMTIALSTGRAINELTEYRSDFKNTVRYAMVHILTTSTTAATMRDIDRMHEVGMGVYQSMFRAICTHVEDVQDYIEQHSGEICKVNLYHTSQESRQRTLERLQGLDAHVALAEQTSLEFTPTGVDKARGLRLLCDHLGFSLDECVVVGDGFNDVEVLEVAGLAVAMGNADDTVKALAHVTVADNDHDGIAEVVERFL